MWYVFSLIGLASQVLLLHQANQVDPADSQRLIEASNAVLYYALGAEDARVVAAMLTADDDPDHKLVTAHARRLIASVRFAQAVDGNFPAGQAATLFEPRIVVPSDFLSLLTMQWDVAGDRATAKVDAPPAEGDATPLMRKVRGLWKLDVTPIPRAANAVNRLTEAINAQAAIIERTVQRIADGKLKTIDEVRQSLAPAEPFFAPATHVPDVVLSLPKGGTARTWNGIGDRHLFPPICSAGWSAPASWA